MAKRKEGVDWIPIPHNLKRDPRSLALEDELDRSLAWAHVVALLLEMAQGAPDGDLAEVRARTIARWAEWDGEPQELVDGLRRAGWMDEEDRWVDLPWTGLLEKRERERERKAAQRARSPADVPRDSDGTHAEVRLSPADVATQEEIRSEETRGEEIPPSGGVGGAPPEPAPKPPKKTPAPDWVDLLAERLERDPVRHLGPITIMEWAEAEDPDTGRAVCYALDGRNERRGILAELEAMEEWWRAQRGRKRWKTSRGMEVWLRKAQRQSKGSWHADQRAKRDADPRRGKTPWSGPPRADTHGAPIRLRPDYTWDERDDHALNAGHHWDQEAHEQGRTAWRGSKVVPIRREG